MFWQTVQEELACFQPSVLDKNPINTKQELNMTKPFAIRSNGIQEQDANSGAVLLSRAQSATHVARTTPSINAQGTPY